MLHKRSIAAACLFVFGALSGCALRAAPDRAPESGPAGAPGPAEGGGTVEPLLEMMTALPQGDPARQAEMFQSAKDAASVVADHERTGCDMPWRWPLRATAAPIPSPPSDSWRNC